MSKEEENHLKKSRWSNKRTAKQEANNELEEMRAKQSRVDFIANQQVAACLVVHVFLKFKIYFKILLKKVNDGSVDLDVDQPNDQLIQQDMNTEGNDMFSIGSQDSPKVQQDEIVEQVF